MVGGFSLSALFSQIKLSPDTEKPLPKKFTSVITDRGMAQKVYTDKNMYAWDMRRLLLDDKSSVTPEQSQQALVDAHSMWDQPCSECAASMIFCVHIEDRHRFWAAEARKHDAFWPIVKDKIVEAFKENPTRTFDDAASSAHVQNWCSGEAIARLFRSYRYDSYLERCLPLMTKKQRLDSVKFSRFMRSNWGRGKGKYLWIAWDEKWFYGMVLRHAKKCEQMGLKRAHLYAKHKNHFTKTMVLAMIGYAFEDHPENGGTGLMLGGYRVEGARVARKQQRETVFADDGTHTFSGPILRENGDVMVVECTLTGSSRGTSDKPKFSCLALFQECVLEQVEAIVSTGGPGSKYPAGPFAGYTPIFHHDNGGGHSEANFVEVLSAVCNENDWGWYPQSPQSPYLNPCDLYLFPMMSRRHSKLLRNRHGKKMPTTDEIWAGVDDVLSEVSSSNIAAAFVQTWRMGGQVEKFSGDSRFLNEGGMHTGVRNDFDFVGMGIKPKAHHGPFDAPSPAPAPYPYTKGGYRGL